ncbi:shematrin-like protein 1 [Eriocheir sinensis]|uniref:shematrin-like protein 1 n=1 Tax=Eriocheir sinensis TaxID=95602 RepID=UPI0021C9B21F|nr:shematrin-like protein 1 [Eriocheir sinensis]
MRTTLIAVVLAGLVAATLAHYGYGYGIPYGGYLGGLSYGSHIHAIPYGYGLGHHHLIGKRSADPTPKPQKDDTVFGTGLKREKSTQQGSGGVFSLLGRGGYNNPGYGYTIVGNNGGFIPGGGGNTGVYGVGNTGVYGPGYTGVYSPGNTGVYSPGNTGVYVPGNTGVYSPGNTGVYVPGNTGLFGTNTGIYPTTGFGYGNYYPNTGYGYGNYYPNTGYGYPNSYPVYTVGGYPSTGNPVYYTPNNYGFSG